MSRTHVDVRPVLGAAKWVDAWAVVDARGNIVVWTLAPTRIDAVKCRIRQCGGQIVEPVDDAEVERAWRAGKTEVEDVARVRVTLLLN